MMIEDKISFGVFMLVINTVTLTLLFDLIRRVTFKLKFIRHPHLYWSSGIIFLAYLLSSFIYNSIGFYLCYVNYLVTPDKIDFYTTVLRVTERSLVMIGKTLLWYYTIRGGFNLFPLKAKSLEKNK